MVTPLGTDTKVLSTAFETYAEPAIVEVCRSNDWELEVAPSQNFYPDFAYLLGDGDRDVIAVDVKSAYRKRNGTTFTLGSYRHVGRAKPYKCRYPSSRILAHIVVGFLYDRVVPTGGVRPVADLESVPCPVGRVESFVQERWRIAADKIVSGNTAHIGSIKGEIDDFRRGGGVFESADEFTSYWTAYGDVRSVSAHREMLAAAGAGS